MHKYPLTGFVLSISHKMLQYIHINNFKHATTYLQHGYFVYIVVLHLYMQFLSTAWIAKYIIIIIIIKLYYYKV